MNAPILINDLRRHTTSIEQDLRSACDRVVSSGWYILGEECRSFEREFAGYCGVAECVALANGTDAIELGLRAIGIGKGSRVANVANAGLYATVAITNIGAEPVFVDVDDNHLMDLDQLAARVRSRSVDAIVITHLYGLLHDMGAVLEIAQPAGIPVLEDCAQAHGAARNGRRAGSFGQVASFSFYPTKNLGALGDGGAVTTNDPETAAKLKRLRQYGWESKYRAVTPAGRNSRLDELQAAVLRTKLPHLDRWNARRRQIATQYSNGIRNPLVQCPPVRGEEYVAHLYVVTCEHRDALQRHVTDAGISTDIHYPIPDHQQPVMQGVASWPALPHTEALSQRVLTLPCFPELADEEVEYIVKRVNAWTGN